MVTFNQLVQLDVEGMEKFAQLWEEIHKVVARAQDGFGDQVLKPLRDEVWKGEGGDAAEAYCARVHMDLGALDAEVKSLRKFIDTEADGASGTGGVKGLEGYQRTALDLRRQGQEKGITINDDGSVSWSSLTDPNDPESVRVADDRAKTAHAIEKQAKDVLDRATADDEWLALSLKVIFGTTSNFETENRAFDTQEATAHDRKVHNQLNNMGAALNAKGMVNAAGLVQHYLDGSGKTVEVEPQQLMKDIPAFQKDVDKTLATDVRKRPDGPFTTEWQSSAPDPKDGDKSMDWYYALNHIQYRTVGEKHGDTITYHVEVQKRYDWGTPSEHRRTQHSGMPKPFNTDLEQADIAHLNTVGTARDFNVVGTSDEMTTTA
ncbi:hypothetical protein [Streptomyces sp. NBC_01465]|uniref:hypothetical protein n=1 Tax=Streptomyces sp. NBC_01465 TaxID=2903878 RepID=UPI002E31A206|nr:hypothetical protein [Streptomyces sp. NBC_01465]